MPSLAGDGIEDTSGRQFHRMGLLLLRRGRAAGPTAATARAHLLQLIELLGGEDLRQASIDVLLELGQLFALVVGEVEHVLEHGGQDLSGGRGRPAEAGPAEGRTTGGPTGPARATARAKPAGSTRAARATKPA